MAKRRRPDNVNSGKPSAEVLAYLRRLGSRGGKLGGRARWKGVSAEERSRQMKAIRARQDRRRP